MEATTPPPGLLEEVKRHFQDCSRVLVFSATCDVLYANCTVLPGEPQQLAASFEDRDAAIARGLWLEGRRYEVHRHHPPLVYGRSMADCEPERSTGIAVCHLNSSSASGSSGDGGRPALYLAVTYEQPCTSARMVPKLAEFAKRQWEAQ